MPSRPFAVTVFLISLFAAFSFLTKTHFRGDGQTHSLARRGPHHVATAQLLVTRESIIPECSEVHAAVDKCSFVKKYCHDEDAGLLPYLQWYYCGFGHVKPLGFGLLVVWLGLLFTTIGIAASDFFSVNLSTIATILGLSESLAGVTFLAFGNGSPDVFSTFAAMSSNSPSMAVGELIGAACFISGAVAGSMALVREFRVDRRTYARDIIFFLVAVSFSMAFLADGHLRFWECCTMVGYYILYVVTVVGLHWHSTRKRRRLRREGAARSHYYAASGHSGDELAGEPYRDESDEESEPAPDGLSRNSPSHDIEALERDGDQPGSDMRSDEEDHERFVVAEVARSMRVVRTGGRRSNKMNPIRPSLVGALEFRSALSQLQRESNLQLSPMQDRSYSDHNVYRHARRGTTSGVPGSAPPWASAEATTTAFAGRNRALSHGNMPASAPLPSILDEEPSENEGSESATPVPTAPYTVGGSLAPPPMGSAMGFTGTAADGVRDRQDGNLRLQIPSGQSSQSGGSSPSSPFPRYSDSPLAVTPNDHGFMLPPPSNGQIQNYFPDMPAQLVASRPWRWWPYSMLPPPHIVFGTLFPTLQGWRDKALWDKAISTISVPSIFLLVVTLPVVESDTTDGSLDDAATLDEARGRRRTVEPGHTAPAISVEPQEIEPEGEWERYQRHASSRRSSQARVQPLSPLLVTLESEETAVAPEEGSSQQAPEQSPAPKPVSDAPSAGQESANELPWNRWLVCVQLFTGPQFAVLILWANMAEDWENPGKELLRMILYTLIGSLVLLGVLFTTTSEHKRPKYHFLLCFMGFIISIAWISTIAGEVVGVLKTFGVVLGISEALLGLTVFAAGNSVGDLVADVTVARLGYPVMAL